MTSPHPARTSSPNPWSKPRPINVPPPGVSFKVQKKNPIYRKSIMVVELKEAQKYSQRTREIYPLVLTLTDNDCTVEGVQNKIYEETGIEMKLLDTNNFPIYNGPSTADPMFWKTPRKIKAIEASQFEELRSGVKRKRTSSRYNDEDECSSDTLAQIRNSLQCIVCLMEVTFPVYICHGCNMITGCYVCVIRCTSCPHCRHDINEAMGPVRGMDSLADALQFKRSSDRDIAESASKRSNNEEGNSSPELGLPNTPEQATDEDVIISD
ncbi:uncharacterized protein [Ptychodera flava]|uniref:uncharacterized protein n=2 Tax=Ptychodera flava TaxID=63121 RepID=UPI00396A2AAC